MDNEASEEERVTLAEVIDRAIREKGYPSRVQYLEQKGNYIPNAAKKWISGDNPFPLFYLQKLVDNLQLPLEDLIAIYGYNPFKPQIDELKKLKNPVGGLIDHYIDLRTGKPRSIYLKSIVGSLINSASTATAWILGISHFPLLYLQRVVTDLQIPLDEIIAVYGRNPFKPLIDELKKSKNPIGGLIDHYIELREGISRNRYLKEKESSVINNADAARSWFVGSNPFPLYYLKNLVDDLQIPLDELIAINGSNPFKPDIEELRKLKNPFGKLVEYYISLRTNKKRQTYLQEKEGSVISNAHAAIHWLDDTSSFFPLLYLQKLVDDLQIPLDEIIAVYGRNPFKPLIDELKKSKNPIGGLIDHYISLRIGKVRNNYLRRIEGSVINSSITATSWILGRFPFPPHSLKAIVDNLQIPYDEVNQFLNYDISDPLQVSLRTRSAPTEQIIQSAFESLKIPTDPKSLYELATSFGEGVDIGISELVDLLYIASPRQIDALVSRRIGRQEVKNYLRQHLSSDSGKSSGGGNGYLPLFLTIARVIPFESYQKEVAVRSHLLDMSLKAYMRFPYETAIQNIDRQLAMQPGNQVMQQVLLETKDYLSRMNTMPGRITIVGDANGH